MLVQGYLLGNFLAIRIRCFRCGAVTATPGLPDGEILPRSAVATEATGTPMVTTSAIGRGDVLVCREAMADCLLTRPRQPPDEPVLLSRAMLEATAADYDRLTGGRLAEHVAASPSAEAPDQGAWPFAWSVTRLRERIDRPGWSWLHQDDDAMATMYVVALHHLMQRWAQHPLLTRLMVSLTGRDRFIRTVGGMAVAKLLFDGGNRVGFSLPGDDLDLHFSSAIGEPLSLALLAPEALQWRQKERRSPDVLRDAVIDAMASARGRGEPQQTGDHRARGVNPAAGLRSDGGGRHPCRVPDSRAAPSRRGGGGGRDAEGAAGGTARSGRFRLRVLPDQQSALRRR